MDSKNLINSLPDGLICHILSFLSTKDAALTSVLSKRWRYLLAFVPNLDFDFSIYKHGETGKRKRVLMRKSFKAFVDRVMALQGNAPLKKFSLRCKLGNDPARVNGWISNVLERGVLDLDLHISADYGYQLPSKVFLNKTLVRLKLGAGGELINDVEDVCLPKLKSLYLHGGAFEDSGAAIAELISGCHVLEELVIINLMSDFWEVCSMSIPTLKRLKLSGDKKFYERVKSVSFDTPNLVYLEFTETVAVKYPKVNFNSLVEARLGLRMTPLQRKEARDLVAYYLSKDEDKYLVVNATSFFMGLSNVKILYLSSDTLEVLTFCCKAIPVFDNLIHLTIETDHEVGWESLPNLLENCPNLETLVFEGLHYRDTKRCEDQRFSFKNTNRCSVKDPERCVCKPWEGVPISLSSSPVKMVKILKFGDIYGNFMCKQIDVIKYFVETMPNLEQVMLYYENPIDDDLSIPAFQALDKVASTKCEIQVISGNVSFSSIVHSSSSTNGFMFYKKSFPV